MGLEAEPTMLGVDHCDHSLLLEWPGAVLFSRIFCDGRNVLQYLSCSAQCLFVSAEILKRARATEHLSFYFYLILINLNLSGPLWLVAAVFASVAPKCLDPTLSPGLFFISLSKINFIIKSLNCSFCFFMCVMLKVLTFGWETGARWS